MFNYFVGWTVFVLPPVLRCEPKMKLETEIRRWWQKNKSPASFHLSAKHLSATSLDRPPPAANEICRDAIRDLARWHRDLPRCPSRQIPPNLGKSRQISLTGGFHAL